MKNILHSGQACARFSGHTDRLPYPLNDHPLWYHSGNTALMQNGTILQFFHWYYPADGSLWKKLAAEAGHLAGLGFTAIWLPPSAKGSNGVFSTGYDLYDPYDLGEFDQKGTIRTKYGTRSELLAAIKAVHDAGMQVYADVVHNHLAGADEPERVCVRKVDPDDRNKFISEPYEIEAYTRFTFPGRKGRYSPFVWDHHCFSGVDFDEKTKECAIYSILNDYGEGWEDVVDDEKGNFDYLMFDDIEFRNPYVREELKKWGRWFWELTRFDGVRLDAVKHINPGWINEWLDHMRQVAGHNLFAVGEYWSPLPMMLRYIEATEGRVSLFDAALHHNLETAGSLGPDFDLSKIFDDTLVAAKPELAVTLVGNHDTQPLQSMEAPIADWFKPLAYALLLLRDKGYPYVFYPDLYGATYTDKGHDGQDCEIHLSVVEELEKLLEARKRFAYGPQRDYLDSPNCIGWTREGDEEHPGSGCAVLLSNSVGASRTMEIGKAHAGKTFINQLGTSRDTVTIDAEGNGTFHVSERTLSVWVEQGK